MARGAEALISPVLKAIIVRFARTSSTARPPIRISFATAGRAIVPCEVSSSSCASAPGTGSSKKRTSFCSKSGTDEVSESRSRCASRSTRSTTSTGTFCPTKIGPSGRFSSRETSPVVGTPLTRIRCGRVDLEVAPWRTLKAGMLTTPSRSTTSS